MDALVAANEVVYVIQEQCSSLVESPTLPPSKIYLADLLIPREVTNGRTVS